MDHREAHGYDHARTRQPPPVAGAVELVLADSLAEAAPLTRLCVTW